MLAHAAPEIEKQLDVMRLDEYWDIFKAVDEASRFFASDDPDATTA